MASTNKVLITYLLSMVLAALPIVLLVDDAHWLNILAFTYLMGGLAAAWNIIGGFGGQFSLGHGVFFAIGAYMTAQGVIRFGFSPHPLDFAGVGVSLNLLPFADLRGFLRIVCGLTVGSVEPG